MKRTLAIAAILALFGAAQYSIKLNPGDSVIVEAPSALPTPTPVPEPIPEPVPTPVPTPPSMTSLGINLPGPDDWNMGARAKVFVDVMKSARCISGAVGADGWPTGASTWRALTTSNNQAQELNWSTSGSRQPKIAGTYLLNWAGASALAVAGGVVQNPTTTSATIVISANDRDVDLKFASPVKNIVMLRPGYPRGTTQTVTNEFKAFIAPFNYIRTMDLQVTNWADENDAAVRFASLGADKRMDWAERPRATYATYNTQWGTPIEAIVTIANECQKNIWICIPWCATDSYLIGLAQYLKANLNPTLTVAFEWSNENWNYAYGFFHSGLFRDEAKAYATAGTVPKLANPPDNDYYYAGRYGVKRTIDASNIFRTAFGDLSRVKPIVSSQFANPSFIADGLNWALRSYPNPPLYYLAGIACAPYYGAGTGMPDQIIASLKADIATRQLPDSKLMWWRGMADAYQIKLYMYEAGCDMGQGTTNLTNKIATAYDPRMQGVTRQYLDSCYLDAGTESLMYFQGIGTRDKWGPAWCLTDDSTDLTQPMYRGAVEFAQTAASTGGLKAEFFRDSNFTTPLGSIIVPVVNHRWQNWSTGGIWGRKDVTTTEARNGSIRFTGRYTGAGTLTVEKEGNDVAVLTRNGDQIALDYRAVFDSNGIAFVRLVETDAMGVKSVVRQSKLTPQ